MLYTRLLEISVTWNQKNLDYEIETEALRDETFYRDDVLKPKEPRLRDWNQINTVDNSMSVRYLKPKEPRLRDWNDMLDNWTLHRHVLKPKEPRLRDWNYLRVNSTSHFLCPTWNQKNLDYEIETTDTMRQEEAEDRLKPKEPRLRDWNIEVHHLDKGFFALKRKEPRLRDWNFWDAGISIRTI